MAVVSVYVGGKDFLGNGDFLLLFHPCSTAVVVFLLGQLLSLETPVRVMRRFGINSLKAV